MVIHPSRETRYGTVALSQKGNTCIQVIFTQSSVSLTTTPEYLPVSGFNVPSLHLSQSSRLHPFQVSQTTATIRVAKVIPDLPVTLHNCPNSGQRKNMKTNSQQSFLFRFKFSSKQFPLPTQSRSFPLTYSTTCSTQTLPQLQLKPRMLPDASEKSRSTFPNRWCPHVSLSHSVVNQQSQHQVPLCLQCHDGSYLSLSALQYLYCQANHNASGFNFKVTSQCKHPSSPTVPAHYRTSGVQLLTSYLTHVAIQFFHEPRSLTKQTRPSRSSCHSFSLSAKITKLSSDSPCSRCQSHHHNLSLSLVTLQALSLLPKSPNFSHNQNADLTCNATATHYHMQLSRCHLFSHAYHYCQELHRLYLPHISYNIGVTGILTFQCPVVSA